MRSVVYKALTPTKVSAKSKQTPLNLAKSLGIFNEIDMEPCFYLIPLYTHSGIQSSWLECGDPVSIITFYYGDNG